MKSRCFHIGLFLFTSLMFCLVMGCGGETAKAKSQIAVIPKGTTHVFWKSIHAGAIKAAQEFDVEIIWQGPQKEDDRNQQIQVVQNFTSRGVDAIVLAPLDDKALVRPVEKSRERGIKTVIIDSALEGEVFDSFVATDNYAGGRLCAKRMSELVAEDASLIMLRYQEGSASTQKREQGFLDGVKEYMPKAKVLSSNQYAGSTVEKALQGAQNLLNRFDAVDGIFCPNESSTQGMLRALEISGRAGEIKFVGFDSSEALLKGLKDGHLHGLAIQSPFKMGYLGVKTAVQILRGESFEKKVDTGVAMATLENLETPAIQQVVNLDPDQWIQSAKP